MTCACTVFENATHWQSAATARAYMECSQSAAWTTNWSLHMTFRAKAFPGRPINSGSTQPGAAHLNGGVIEHHQCITPHSGNTPASPDIQPTTWLCTACIPSTTSISAPTQPIIAMTIYTHASTVTNWSTFHSLQRSSSGVCGNSTTTATA